MLLPRVRVVWPMVGSQLLFPGHGWIRERWHGHGPHRLCRRRFRYRPRVWPTALSVALGTRLSFRLVGLLVCTHTHYAYTACCRAMPGDPHNCISGVAGIINGFGVLGGVVQGGLVALTYVLLVRFLCLDSERRTGYSEIVGYSCSCSCCCCSW